MSRSILLVDDDQGVLEMLARFFAGRGWAVARAATGERALDQFDTERPDLVLLDLDLPDTSGLPVLSRLRDRDPEVAVLMLTGHGDIETAVEAMRLGAENFLTKPVELDHLGAAVERAAEKVELRRRNRFLTEQSRAGNELEALGGSAAMRSLAERIARVAAGDGTVLLEGETGTGKGWVARAIHDLSARSDAPFVEVNCGGLTATFLDSELFGHEKGAFTDAREQKRGLFEVADRGTIFLDEIGDLAPELQPKLLKVLESRRFRRLGGTRELTVDVRLVAATNRDLKKEVDAGRFRQDLYYRLAVLPVALPPLRERTADDIAGLAYRLLAELGRRIPAAPDSIGDDALDLLVRHAWPGNIRELRNLLERVIILADGAETIRAHHLPPELRNGAGIPAENGGPVSLEDVERRHIARMLERTGGNRSRTARLLGISRATLYDKLERYDLKEVGL